MGCSLFTMFRADKKSLHWNVVVSSKVYLSNGLHSPT